MKKYQKKSLLAGLFGFIVFIFGVVIIASLAGQRLGQQIQTDAKLLINHIDAADAEREKLLSSLNAYNYTQCNDSTLLAMRRALFDATYVVDIGFFQNDKLVCTAGNGILANPLDDRAPDYIERDGVRVRFAPEFSLILFPERIMQVVIVRQHNYNVILQPSKIDLHSVHAKTWQVFFKSDQTINHLTGTEGVYKKVSSSMVLPYESLTLCSQVTPNYCVAVFSPWREFISKKRMLFLICLTLCVLAGLSAGLMANYYLATKRSTWRRVRRGLHQHSFYWTYQPIINLQTQQVIGCEVLARFEDKFGALTPDEFIPLIRKHQQTWLFTQTMITTMLHELSEAKELPDKFKVSVNIFPYDVQQGRLSELIHMPALLESRFSICLEITEDEYLDSNIAHSHLQSLADAGFTLSIDDFGTGYSNLANLQNLSFHQLKIDRTFVQDIATAGLKASMIPNIMELVTKLGYTCVAEGIETQEQEAILKTAGVQYGQGWKYGKPMPIKQFKQFMGTQKNS
ncbi:MAG: EAL domain-containing protein [Pseudoalteromonas prydzensis]|uniref:cyclic-guanylate-specific phosphodiesterase n=2 Tax=root TaxID=1 RepID=A0A7V1CZN6_9GAMM|nr:EAL domain-containing protein [Pseudoalteromonas prydzensis]HEA17218.1 EAL domain-containing protein [Pseudoalteromonas prydzensis]